MRKKYMKYIILIFYIKLLFILKNKYIIYIFFEFFF